MASLLSHRGRGEGGVRVLNLRGRGADSHVLGFHNVNVNVHDSFLERLKIASMVI